MLKMARAAIGFGCCALASCRTGEAILSDGELDRSRVDTRGSAWSAREPAVVVDGRAIGWSALAPGLIEGAGGAVLEEALLDVLLERALRERGLTVGEEDVSRERALLAETLGGDLSASALEALRRERGIGERRLRGLVRRNAALRALVRDEVEVGEAEVGAAYEIIFGERVRVRLLVVRTLAEARALRGELSGGTGDLSERFSRRAREASLDGSAGEGGLVEAMSLRDPAYPAALRGAIAATEPGQMSAIAPLDAGYAIALVEGPVAPAETTVEAEHDELHARLLARAQRVAMAALAQQLLGGAEVRIDDPLLAEAWASRRR
ncbi:MAG: hypothetical protein H6811_00360 [Phycisphaeraceae bacterium]|nr:hypothetical protein [Phycisphaeraceae bacterium]